MNGQSKPSLSPQSRSHNMKTNGDKIDMEALKKMGLSDDQIKVWLGKLNAESGVGATAFPGPMREAFPAEPIVVFGVSIRPVVACDWKIFEKIESPVYKQMQEMSKDAALRQPTSVSDEDSWAMVYQFTRPCFEAYKEACKGRQYFIDRSAEVIACQMQPTAIAQMVEAVSKQIEIHLSTAMKFIPESEGEKGFQQPPADSQKSLTGRDGGLDTSEIASNTLVTA